MPRSALDLWRKYEPSAEMPWNLSRVVHLHRRAAFAAPWTTLQQDLADGPEKAISRLLPNENQSVEVASDFEALAQTIGEAATASGNADRLKAWWLFRMLRSPDPLSERLTLMWHNHFATSNRKVRDLVRMRNQNEIFRKRGSGLFRNLLEEVLKDPALLEWLDASSNRKGSPNENLARELMELFTLGIGNYSEQDVKEAARALTGWTVADNQFSVAANRHDDGEKVVLGHRGTLSGDDLQEILVQHPMTSQRIAGRLIQTFMGEEVVADDARTQLADGLREHDLDIGWAVEKTMRSRLFFSDQNLRSKVLGPTEYVVGTLRAIECTDPMPSTLILADYVSRMGQDLFYPPNVGGWREGRSWLASRMVIARANFAADLVDGELWNPPRAPDLESLLQQQVGSQELEVVLPWLAELLWGFVPDDFGDTIAIAKTSDQPLDAAVTFMLARPECILG